MHIGVNGRKPLVYSTRLGRRKKIEFGVPISLQQSAIIIPISVITGRQLNGMRT